MKRALGLEQLSRVSVDHQVYIFSGLRDFIWETPQKAKKQYLDYVVRAEDLVSCDLYLNRFGWKNIAGHIILVFTFTSGEQLALSVEARLEEGVRFSFLRSLFYHYPIVAIWGTSEDILGLRKVRGDRLICYSLQIEKSDLILFFEQVLKKTDYLNSGEEYYNIFMNNCTSVLWKIVSFTFGFRFWPWQVFLPGCIDRLLYKLGLISRKQYKKPQLV